MRRTLLRLLSSFRSSRAERELAREIRSHLQLLEDQVHREGHGRGGGALRRPAGIRRRRAGEGTSARSPDVPVARRLAHGPETRRPDAREVSRPHDRGRPGDGLRDLGWHRHLPGRRPVRPSHPAASGGRAPGRNSQHGRGGERSRGKGPPRLPRVAAVAAIADRRRRLARLEPKPRSSPPAMRGPSTSPR